MKNKLSINAPDLSKYSTRELWILAAFVFSGLCVLLVIAGTVSGLIWWELAQHTHNVWLFIGLGIGTTIFRLIKNLILAKRKEG